MRDTDTEATPPAKAAELDTRPDGLRVSVWIEPDAQGGSVLVLSCTNRAVPDRRLPFATVRLAEDAVAPCSMRFMDDIKRDEAAAAPPPL